VGRARPGTRVVLPSCRLLHEWLHKHGRLLAELLLDDLQQVVRGAPAAAGTSCSDTLVVQTSALDEDRLRDDRLYEKKDDAVAAPEADRSG
jgi:hypothetical protein